MLVIDKERHEFKIDDETVLYYVIPSRMQLTLLSKKFGVAGSTPEESAETLLEAMRAFVVDWTGVEDGEGNAVPYGPGLLEELPIDCFPRFVEEVLVPAQQKVLTGGLEKNLEAT